MGLLARFSGKPRIQKATFDRRGGDYSGVEGDSIALNIQGFSTGVGGFRIFYTVPENKILRIRRVTTDNLSNALYVNGTTSQNLIADGGGIVTNFEDYLVFQAGDNFYIDDTPPINTKIVMYGLLESNEIKNNRNFI